MSGADAHPATRWCLPQWLVSTSEFEALTVVQQFTAPNCESDYSKSWNTYLIYEVRCDALVVGGRVPPLIAAHLRAHPLASDRGSAM